MVKLDRCSLAAAAAATLLVLGGWARAETIKVTDLAGREVNVEQGADRVILGEGRILYGTSLLDRDNPFDRLVGWAEDMILYDPGTYRKYREKYPEAESLPRFGSAYAADFSAEKAISLDANLVVLPLSGYYKAIEGGIVANLERAGIPTVFVDLREHPLENTVPSIDLLGRVFGREDEARAFNDFYLRETRKVTLEAARIPDAERIHVIMERAAGFEPETCCLTFGDANLGALLEAAGGINWGSSRFAGVGGEINPEAIFAEDPRVLIGTGADWSESTPGSRSVPFGYEATPEVVQAAMQALAERKGWPELRAVRDKRFYSVYHQFYTSPAHIVALQVFAKWLYPDRFAELDPAATMREYHERFSPIGLSGVFWAQLQ